MKKVLIFGSCVSRDAFEYAEPGQFEIVGYYARSSLASLATAPNIDKEILEKIESKFQRKMVEADMTKTFWRILDEAEFDIFVMDFIDERAHLLELNDGAIHTISTEYKKAAHGRFQGRQIANTSDKKFELWVKSFQKLIVKLSARNCISKLRINKVIWSSKTDLGTTIAGYTSEQINNANTFLAKLYSEAEKFLKPSSFITYPDNLLYCDTHHKWGVHPFHYNSSLYNLTIHHLQEQNIAESKNNNSNQNIIINEISQVSERHTLNLDGREFVYYFSPALEQNKPIIFILHGHGYAASPSQFKSPNWNVVCPMDSFGYGGMGSWFLGENGNFFWIDAMKRILESIRAKVGNGRLYFWGSSMGGYGSLVHGYLLHATAVYANVPQTWLLGSNYSEGGMKKYFEPIFANSYSEFNDLKLFFKARSRTKYFLCFNQLEGAKYLEEHCLSFIGHLHSFRQPLYLEVRPTSSHGKNHGVSEAIALFKKYQDL
jgi:Family of unknown function (DUF6270)